MLTNQQIEDKLVKISNDIKGLTTSLNNLITTVNTKISLSDLNRAKNDLLAITNDHSTLINELENKLSKVILPEETRYYLKEGEVSSFQANFNTLRAMMTRFTKLYENLVAYQANLTNSNSI